MRPLLAHLQHEVPLPIQAAEDGFVAEGDGRTALHWARHAHKNETDKQRIEEKTFANPQPGQAQRVNRDETRMKPVNLVTAADD